MLKWLSLKPAARDRRPSKTTRFVAASFLHTLDGLLPIELRLYLTVERFNSLPEDTHIVIHFITSELQLNSNIEKQRQTDMQIKAGCLSFIIAAVVLMKGIDWLQETPFTSVIIKTMVVWLVLLSESGCVLYLFDVTLDEVFTVLLRFCLLNTQLIVYLTFSVSPLRLFGFC